jgi:hypothetical protein
VKLREETAELYRAMIKFQERKVELFKETAEQKEGTVRLKKGMIE